ncbi:Nn.00g059160.m01.CDS01 [Neocucurbitaria sp. VM-36]
MSASDPIPVSILLDKELSVRFCMWQISQPEHREIGMIQSAAEYCKFRKDENAQKFGQSRDALNRHVGSKCGHLLHPLEELDVEYCPVCEVAVNLDLLHLITKAWDGQGGPWSQYSSGNRQTFIFAWHKIKLELIELVTFLEEEAEDEVKWEGEHPEDAETARETHSAVRAVNLARLKSRYPSTLEQRQPVGIPEQARMISSPVPTGKEERKVRFVFDTKFERGRPQHAYRRNNPQYTPGYHAAGTLRELIDTSHLTNILYNARQLKVLMRMGGPIAGQMQASKSECIAELHPQWRGICHVLKGYIRHENLVARAAFFEDLRKANFLLVGVYDGKVTEAFPYELEEIEDLEDANSKGSKDLSKVEAPKMSWTSLLDGPSNGHAGDVVDASEMLHETKASGSEDLTDETTPQQYYLKGIKKRAAAEDFEQPITKRDIR